MAGFTDFAPTSEPNPSSFDDFAKPSFPMPAAELPALVKNPLVAKQVAKWRGPATSAYGGAGDYVGQQRPDVTQEPTTSLKEMASVADMVASMPGFVYGTGRGILDTTARLMFGEGHEAYTEGRKLSGDLQELYGSNFFSNLLKGYEESDKYKSSNVDEFMHGFSEWVKDYGLRVSIGSDNKIAPDAVPMMVDTLMSIGAVKGGKATAEKWFSAKEYKPEFKKPRLTGPTADVGSEVGGVTKPRMKGPAADIAPEVKTFDDFIPAGKPKVKMRAVGEVDPALLGWLATGAALTTAGGLIYAEHKRSGRDLLDIIKDPKGPAAAPAEEEPQPTERGTFLSKVPEWLVGGAMIAGAVKGKGGMWHPEAVERLATPLWKSASGYPHAQIEPAALNAAVRGVTEAGNPMKPEITDTAKWSQRAVRNYLNKYAGTKEDPLRDIRIPLRDTDIRWEDAWDQAIHSREARTMTDVPKGTPPTEQVFDLAPRYASHIERAQNAITSYLSHVGDYLRQSVAPEKLQQYDLVRAVKETAEADKRAAAAMEKASAASMKDMPVYKAYPDGYKWVELKLPEKLTEEQTKNIVPRSKFESLLKEKPPEDVQYIATDSGGRAIRNSYTGEIAAGRTPEETHLAGQLSMEGNQLGHCVGGYCPQVASGESRIFSLRDSKGRSHVTVEVGTKAPGAINKLGEESILQIKGKQNRAPSSEYLPYVQDFVKSGKWGDVGDIQNTGLYRLEMAPVRGEKRLPPSDLAAHPERDKLSDATDRLLERGIKFATREEIFKEAGIKDQQPDHPRGWRGQEGAASPELLKHLAALGLGAAAGSYLSSDHPAYGAVIGAIAGLSLTAFRRPNTLLERELRQSVEQAIRAVSPESLGPKAKQAASLIAKAISERMQKNSAIYHSSEGRRRYWDKHSDQQTPFIKGFERGWTPKDPALKAITTFYREWSDRIFKQDAKLGIEYEQRDNYLYHVFEDGDKVAQFFEQKYGAKWGDPRFSKARGFDLYDEAIKAGYKPRTTNPEEIMLMRQFASNVAEMRINALRDMNKYDLARTVKGNARELGDVQWRSPNGELYWVHEHAAQILHNAFDTPSLWNMKGALGTGFRAAMYTKNTLVPVILNLSLFHPLHLSLGMDNSAAMLRASKELVAGTSTPAQYIGRMARYGNPITAIYDSVWTNPKAGWRPFKLWKGQVPAEAITEADRLVLQYTHEGGFVPEMSKEYRTGAIESFKKAWDQNSLTAIPKFALAVPQWLQKPLFEYWIPSLKYASYLNDVKTALKTNPALLDDPVSRGVAFRKLAKSVENRYGEMAYDTLFWNRIIRDLGVANTLSLGWSLGFFREYGGALSEAGQASVKLDLKGRVARGELDRAMFVAMYTTNTALYGGLLTWALTGKPPTQWMDYFYPRTGDKNPDGSDSRVNTMFYSRELLGMWKHAQNEGVLPGIGQFLTNKLAPTWGIAKGLWSNMDFMGREISDPNSFAFKQLSQKVQWAMQEITPISIQSIRKSPEVTPKTVALGVTGFAPAPRYATETPVEGKIAAVFRQYHKSTTPYERARYSEEVSELYKLRQKGDTDKFYDKLQELREKHHLTHEQVRRIRRESQIPGTERMFRALTEEQQEKLLRSMSPEEREKYSRLAHRKLKRKLRSEQ